MNRSKILGLMHCDPHENSLKIFDTEDDNKRKSLFCIMYGVVFLPHYDHLGAITCCYQIEITKQFGLVQSRAKNATGGGTMIYIIEAYYFVLTSLNYARSHIRRDLSMCPSNNHLIFSRTVKNEVPHADTRILLIKNAQYRICSKKNTNHCMLS